MSYWERVAENMLQELEDLDTALQAVLVVPVNAMGVMGAGLAKVAKQRWPAPCKLYREACHNGTFFAGSVLLVPVGGALFARPDFLLFAGTKDSWRRLSNPHDVRTCFLKIGVAARKNPARVYFIPALGCGRGGLPWVRVADIAFGQLHNSPADCRVYAPLGQK